MTGELPDEKDSGSLTTKFSLIKKKYDFKKNVCRERVEGCHVGTLIYRILWMQLQGPFRVVRFCSSKE